MCVEPSVWCQLSKFAAVYAAVGAGKAEGAENGYQLVVSRGIYFTSEFAIKKALTS